MELDFHSNVIHSLTIELSDIIKISRRCIIAIPKLLVSNMTYCFGSESVSNDSQSYRSFSLLFLSWHGIIGKDYEKEIYCEIVKKGKKTMLIRIASKIQMKVIFTVMDQCGTYIKIRCSSRASIRKVVLKLIVIVLSLSTHLLDYS